MCSEPPGIGLKLPASLIIHDIHKVILSDVRVKEKMKSFAIKNYHNLKFLNLGPFLMEIMKNLPIFMKCIPDTRTCGYKISCHDILKVFINLVNRRRIQMNDVRAKRY